jgi:ankyrin repeat protein
MSRRSNNQKLRVAIEEKDLTTVSSLIKSGAVNVNCKPPPLNDAAADGCVEIVALLLDAGADIDAFNSRNGTACHCAVRHNHFEALRFLIDRGANVTVVRAAEESLFGAASQNTDHRITILLLEAGAPLDNVPPHQLIALVSNMSVVKSLLARNVDLSALRSWHGRTLCHRIVRTCEDTELLRGAVEAAGLDVNACDRDGAAPLHIAAASHNAVAVRCLVELGANVDVQQSSGETALILACANNDENDGLDSCVELLLALGADCLLTNSVGESACHWSISDREPLCAILAAGGDLDQPDLTNITPRAMSISDDRPLPTADEIDLARRRVAKIRLDLVRHRATEICIGLQSLSLDALQLCEILMQSFGALGSLIQFHQWWKIATKVKHFSSNRN